MHQLYVERRAGVEAHAEATGPMFVDLRRALAAHRLGPIAARFGGELIATVDLERGAWASRAVDVRMLVTSRRCAASLIGCRIRRCARQHAAA